MSVWASVCQCRTIVTTGATSVMIMTTGVKMTDMARDVIVVVVAEVATKLITRVATGMLSPTKKQYHYGTMQITTEPV